MTSGTWTHDIPSPAKRARALGLPVNSNMPENVFRLMELYQQADAPAAFRRVCAVPYRAKRPAALEEK